MQSYICINVWGEGVTEINIQPQCHVAEPINLYKDWGKMQKSQYRFLIQGVLTSGWVFARLWSAAVVVESAIHPLDERRSTLLSLSPRRFLCDNSSYSWGRTCSEQAMSHARAHSRRTSPAGYVSGKYTVFRKKLDTIYLIRHVLTTVNSNCTIDTQKHVEIIVRCEY